MKLHEKNKVQEAHLTNIQTLKKVPTLLQIIMGVNFFSEAARTHAI